ncbi:MBL fold metallo-hydrolase [Galbibacter pacificus]|uniref:MBL fold metallo-hydrolase n=1 Tax=Galbibacter pacificus TaxID=2996052 RepID=A0ABT6FNW7_9FLAO|nr:MBL fold metallo-hydrolase [Galbibacter pacificus]MDG3581477.1 MBL fold metallo-hydrolase [Galbibacter pacificus]MDG3584955.1 MBL fold metallo-hydrolase [Galbibacter pacificus]
MTYTYIGLFIFLFSCTTNNGPVYTKLQPNIYEINNQYFYSEKVHTYLIELDDKVLLFDIPTYSDEIKEFITSFKKPAFAILSHGSCGISDGTKWQKEIGLKVYAHEADTNHPWLRMKPDVFFTEMPKLGENIEVIYTPGHSSGAVCVLDKSSKSLFSGDTFYGDKNGKIRDFSKENPADYENPSDRIESCKKLLDYDFENVYPFHYKIIEGNGGEKLAKYLNEN